MSEPVKGIGVHDLSVEMRTGAVLIDVREPYEFDEVHVGGAVLVPLQTLPDHVENIRDHQSVYVICRSGGRSHSACEWLRGNDVNAINVLGGTLAWIEADLPTESGPASPVTFPGITKPVGMSKANPNDPKSNEPKSNRLPS